MWVENGTLTDTCLCFGFFTIKSNKFLITRQCPYYLHWLLQTVQVAAGTHMSPLATGTDCRRWVAVVGISCVHPSLNIAGFHRLPRNYIRIILPIEWLAVWGNVANASCSIVFPQFSLGDAFFTLYYLLESFFLISFLN